MTSSNGTIFRVTGPLCGEFTGPGEFPTQRPVTRSFDVYFDLRLNKRLSKKPWGWWFETLSWSLWRQCNATCQDGQNLLCDQPLGYDVEIQSHPRSWLKSYVKHIAEIRWKDVNSSALYQTMHMNKKTRKSHKKSKYRKSIKLGSGVGITNAPFVNFSVSKI